MRSAVPLAKHADSSRTGGPARQLRVVRGPRRLTIAAAIGACVAALPAMAQGQSPASGDPESAAVIADLRRQLQEMRRRLDTLEKRGTVSATQAAPRSGQHGETRRTPSAATAAVPAPRAQAATAPELRAA
jgi:hypothetical protein